MANDNKGRRMTPIYLGDYSASKPMAVDLEVLLESRLLVQANSGGGKSRTIRRLLEQSFGAVPHVVIDIDGEFNTLREKFPYVLASAGTGGDCRADAKTAPLLARRVLEIGFSVIVDISEMKAHERLRFVRAFLEALMEAKRALWRPLLVVVDEAHVFCPEKGQAESAAAVIDLMTRGRKRGFCGVLATQRLAKLHKDTAAEANNKLIGRTGLDVDMKRAADDLGFSGREQSHQLRVLEPGQFYAYGPALTPQVQLGRIGAVKTTHPEPGNRGHAAPPPAPEKLKKVLEQLADLPKQAEEAEGEVERLRREVSALLEAFVQDLQAWSRRTAHAQALVKPGMGPRIPLPAPATRAPAPRSAARADKPESLVSAPQQRILDALAWLQSVGVKCPDKVQLALLAGASPKSSGYQNNLGFLRTAGLLDYPMPGRVELRDAGLAAAAVPEIPPSTADLHRTLEEKLPGPQWRILDTLIRIYPDALERAALADDVGYSPESSGFQNSLGALRSLGFIDYPSRGFVAALPVLFLEGR